MTKIRYRATATATPFLNYRYNRESEINHMRGVSHTLASVGVKTADSIICYWADFAHDELRHYHLQDCWRMHYEQFGRLMYHFLDVFLRKNAYLKAGRFSQKQMDFFPDDKPDFIIDGPNSAEDRTLYRCWFGLIGHPDFQAISIAGIEGDMDAYWRYVIAALAIDLGRAMNDKNYGKSGFLHL